MDSLCSDWVDSLCSHLKLHPEDVIWKDMAFPISILIKGRLKHHFVYYFTNNYMQATSICVTRGCGVIATKDHINHTYWGIKIKRIGNINSKTLSVKYHLHAFPSLPAVRPPKNTRSDWLCNEILANQLSARPCFNHSQILMSLLIFLL